MVRKKTVVKFEKIDQIGAIRVWVVNGPEIRRHLDPEFTNFGQHFRFPFIPKNEFWIDKEAALLDESGFFIEHLLTEHRLMKLGCDYEDALLFAGKKERAERMQSQIAREIMANHSKVPLEKIYKEVLGKTSGNKVTVWVIDGHLVRTFLFLDFTEGGHDLVYNFVPEKEVWLDDDLTEEERPFILLHELYERSLMAKGLPYLKAHPKASKLEWGARHSPKKLKRNLKSLGWTAPFKV